ncbi:MAG: DUF3365 domain-containing protein [Gammaproteobacteria bacterium]|nr:DUF3365 domain-containing protein [Gammaproteobacteria bacterium]
MFKKGLLLSVTALMLSAPLYAEDLEKRAADARKVIKEFATTLKGEMKAGMKAGGPTKAIKVCNLRATHIAIDSSATSNWDVGRTSLKVRNHMNDPDAWEKAVLLKFEQRKKAGENVKKMDFYEVVDRYGEKQFRYMKAIPTGPICLQCHGEKLEPAVQMRLNTLYSEDQAKGYKLGDIRGAFTLSQTMN